jgi:SAM-dependent methyltransferase
MMALGQALLERVAEPVFSCLREHPASGSLPEILAQNHAGWAFPDMLAYAYADWTGARASLHDRVVADVARYVREPRSALVLGCGAGALVGELAGVFDVVHGVDLSLPTLLLGRRLLDGESVRLPLITGTARAEVTIGGGTTARPGARLVVGDAAALPFADGSVGLVVTPYLLDVVPDPAAVLGEVNRVLAPEGIWIQHGLPFRLHGDSPVLPQRADGAWPALAAHFGFDLLAIERVEHLHLELRTADSWSMIDVHPPFHAVSRKRAPVPRSGAAQAFAAYFAGDASALLERVPSLGDAAIEVVTRLGPGGREMSRWLRLGKGLRLRGARQGELLALLTAIDGARPVAAIAEALSAGGHALPEREVVLVLDVLRRMGLVDLGR